jgi:CTP:molybdopterin cytidylyltransferase MocA
LPGSEARSTGLVLVLAAGRGRRMGGPKALMSVGGRAWWRTQAERLAASRRDAAWVVSPEVRAAMGEAGGRGGRAARLAESDPDAPMFASLLKGIELLRPDPPAWVHVLPVDVPAPRRATLERLESAAGARGVAVPVAPASGGSRRRPGHPVCLSWAWIEGVLIPEARVQPVGSLRLDRLIAGTRVAVEVHDESVAVNLNTPADVRRWEARAKA